MVAATVTTFLASAVLSLCTLTFFDKFGSFLCVTMAASTFLSIVFFQAVLAVAAPARPEPFGTCAAGTNGSGWKRS